MLAEHGDAFLMFAGINQIFYFPRICLGVVKLLRRSFGCRHLPLGGGLRSRCFQSVEFGRHW